MLQENQVTSFYRNKYTVQAPQYLANWLQATHTPQHLAKLLKAMSNIHRDGHFPR